MTLQPKPISRYSWRSLQARITLLTLAVFLSLLWSLAWYAERALRSDMEHLLGQQQLATVTLHAQELNRTMHTRLRTLEDVGKLAIPLMQGTPQVLSSFLQTRLTLVDFFTGGMTFVDVTGRALATYPMQSTYRDVDLSQRPTTGTALREGRSVIGTPVISPEFKAPVVSFASPIRDANGTIIGALVGLVDLGKPNFLTPVLASRYGQSGSYLVLAGPARLQQSGTEQVPLLQDLPPSGVPRTLDHFAQGMAGSALLHDPQGQPVLASGALIEATGWRLLATLPTHEAFAPVNKLTHRILLATLLVSLLATALTWWLLHRQLQPIHTAFRALLRQAQTGQAIQALPTASNDEVGQLIHGFNYLLDTLAQREAALQQSEATTRQTLAKSQALTHKLERYQQAMDNHVLITISDAHGRITHANPRFCEVSGYTLAELLQNDFRLLNSGFHPKSFFAALYENVMVGKTWQGEVCNRAKNGQLFWLAMTVVPFMDEDGQPVEFLSMNTDITERMANESELQNYREHLEELVQQRTHELHRAETSAKAAALYARSLLEASVDPLLTISPQGQITDVNEATEAVTGVHRDELVGSHFSAFFTEPAKAQALSHKVIAHGRVNNYPLTIRHLTGGQTELLFNASVYRDQEDQVLGVFAAARDVSILNAAREAANAANQAKSSFLANMSHEIRTPMNGVIGMVDMLQQTPLTDAQRRMLGTVHQSSLALLDILNDILDYSKIEAGKLAVESLPTQLHEVVQGVVQLMQTAARAKSIELSLWVSPQLPTWVWCDPTRLRQVLLNLVGNALKFTHSTPEKTGRVNVRVASGHRANGQAGLYLRISDNGIGIAPATLAKLFTPFTQADASTARRFGGSGLGLSISQRLVELMGGRIKAHSTDGEGSEFTVELPLREAPAQGPANSPFLTEPTPARLPVPHRPLAADAPLILIAEDNETNRDVLREQLQLLGYRAEVAVDGTTALAMWQRGHYALLLTDCHMPNMDGFELTAAIRQLAPDGVHHPIIAVTANAMRGEAERCRAAGMDDYLIKPLRLQDLRPMLAKWLPNPASPPPQQPPEAPQTSPAAVAPGEPPVWDSLALSEIVGTNLAMQQRLLAKYLVSARAQAASLHRAAQAQDTTTVTGVAHTLKSASRTVGAMALGALCQQLEAAGAADDGPLCTTLGAQVPAAFMQAETKIAAALRFPVSTPVGS
ncbi:PAS domain S-box protein [Rhodoferax sp. U2-2l]|uniref:ATP-binding protein n=1 Tax=Rhodoferax sp. U2-2l TaxID=2884000 RepID=UPI001D0ACA5B|nr:ATP-binding protein [Rhodoferax sp. U2-2l]MCB8746068.1 PAS domain S-box protein [Rhodoferax sp. U2-2l]